MTRARNKQNSYLNGEWGRQNKWGKRITSGLRRAEGKRIIREELKD